MTDLNVSGETYTSPKRKFIQALQSIGKFLFKMRTHVIILTCTVVYLAVAPGVYARYFVKIGKPDDLKIELPASSPLISYSIGSTEEGIVANQKVYQIVGWAFLQNKPDQSLFNKYLVLNSKDRIYFFPYEEVLRWDLTVHFKDLGLDLLNSGFWAFIAPEAVRSGTYNIGFLFVEKAGEEVFYTCSNRYFIRTPNSVAVEAGPMPDETLIVTSSVGDVSLQYGAGKEIGPLHLASDKQIQLNIEDFSIVTITGRPYGRVSGWAFLKDEPDQSQYNRWIVLKSDENTLYFPVTSVERPDVPEVFPELESRFSGFAADIYEEMLPPGMYEMGFLFQSRTRGPDYVTTTPWIITRTSSEFTMGKK